MSYFIDNWGSLVGLISLAITIIGFGVAIQRATQARRSAESAKTASIETRLAITRALTVVDLERAIALIQRLKVLHREQKWEVSLERYQDLRQMLADINSRHPEMTQDLRAFLREAVVQVLAIENYVDEVLQGQAEPSVLDNVNRTLNYIQVSLEGAVGSTQFAED